MKIRINQHVFTASTTGHQIASLFASQNHWEDPSDCFPVHSLTDMKS